jgi:hypothetical protein
MNASMTIASLLCWTMQPIALWLAVVHSAGSFHMVAGFALQFALQLSSEFTLTLLQLL